MLCAAGSQIEHPGDPENRHDILFLPVYAPIFADRVVIRWFDLAARTGAHADPKAVAEARKQEAEAKVAVNKAQKGVGHSEGSGQGEEP